MRGLVLALALALAVPTAATLPGCAAVQTTHAQSVHQAYTTIASLRDLAAGLLIRGRISVERAEAIRDSLNTAEATVDVLSAQGGDLSAIQRELAKVEAELRAAQ